MKFQKILVAVLIVFLAGTSVFAQSRKKKNNRTVRPFYKTDYFININGGINYFYPNSIRPVCPPLYINPELTVIENVTAGLIFLHYAYNKEVQFKNDGVDYYSLWPAEQARFHHYLLGLKASYHLNDFITANLPVTVDPAKWDFYTSLMVGYNFISVNSDDELLSPASEAKQPRFGLTLGARVYPMPRISVYSELGYTPYGFGTIGLSYMLGEKF